MWLFHWLVAHVAGKRPPNFVVGADDPGGAYLRRWYLTPWRGWYQGVDEAERTRWQRFVVAATKRLLPNLYLHHFLRDDDDRALHDHPSAGFSFILYGGYIEHTIAAGGIHKREEFAPGRIRFMRATHAHRIELYKSGEFVSEDGGITSSHIMRPCWTLFLFLPTFRRWGFHCQHKGWVPYEEFTAAGKPGEVGKGCA
jgi:hypothetical protein